MPVPSSISQLSETSTSNSPIGSETVGPQMNAYIQAAFAFIKQIADGVGLVPTVPISLNGQTLNMVSQKVLNLAPGTVSSTSTDAVNGSQLQKVYKVGEVKMWHGAVANISATWGPGWQLADGTNGTANLKDQFIVGAGNLYAVNATGGATSNTLSIANLPSHNHTVTITDNGHNHGHTDNGHAHAVYDPGHSHGIQTWTAGGVTGGGRISGSYVNNADAVGSTNGAGTGVAIYSSTTSVTNNPATTGITAATANTGTGTAVPNLPPYYALCFIEYTGIGA